jgi:hypothetical protein
MFLPIYFILFSFHKQFAKITAARSSRNQLSVVLKFFLHLQLCKPFYLCTVHYGIYILFIHQQMHFLLNLEKFNFTLEYT